MYVAKTLVYRVIKLFREEPKYRDDQWATMERLINDHYSAWYGSKNISQSAKIVFDISRAFRYVQQHIPQLRGTTWKKRQIQGGERFKGEITDKELKKACEQLKLDLEF